MDKHDLYKSIGQMDEALLARTEEKRSFRPIRILAASLALIIGIAGLSWLFWPEPASASGFVITAYAEDGAQTELSVQDSCFNSGGFGVNIFGVDKPIFSFAINPEIWETQGASYMDYRVDVSYAGQENASKDKHIMVVNVVPAEDVEGAPTYMVTGWFDEPMDVTVLVVEEASSRLVAQITVHVRYLPEQEAYELTVTESKTYFDEYLYTAQAPQRPEYPLTQQQLNASTAELVDYIMEYPYLIELMMSSTFDSQHGYDALRVAYHYNGFLELETRPDAASALLEEYAEVVLNPTEENALDDNLLWTLLSVSPYKQLLTQEEAARFEELQDIKRQQDEAQLEQEAATFE